MKKYTPQEKDEVLSRFYNDNVGNYTSIIEIIEILVSDGYIKLHTSVNGSAYHITDKGKGFFLQGGYVKERNTRRKQTVTFYFNMLISALVSAIVSYIVSSMNK